MISEHSQKSLTSKSLDFDSRQNSVSSEVSEAIRIPQGILRFKTESGIFQKIFMSELKTADFSLR